MTRSDVSYRVVTVVYHGKMRFSWVECYLAKFNVKAEAMTKGKIILRGAHADMVLAIGPMNEAVFALPGCVLRQTGPQVLEMEATGDLRFWPPSPRVDGWVDLRDFEFGVEENESEEEFESEPEDGIYADA